MVEQLNVVDFAVFQQRERRQINSKAGIYE
jgi:hypothetical protein